jgi:mono/diheme cytochrome c family protein
MARAHVWTLILGVLGIAHSVAGPKAREFGVPFALAAEELSPQRIANELAAATQAAPTPRPSGTASLQPGRREPDPARAKAGPSTAIEVFRTKCVECHDNDGKGGVVRDDFPSIPDFTDPRWHAARSDAELGRSILEGKGKSMPRMKQKLGSVDVRQMVAFVRAFRGGKQIVDDEPDSVPALVGPRAEANPTAEGLPGADRDRPGSTSPSVAGGGRLFRRYCARCHSSDGKGTEARDSLAAIPDFTRLPWQKSRSNAQMAVSVLDGKGTGMPPFRSKVTREQARELVSFIRTFAPGFTSTRVPRSSAFDAEFGKLTHEFEDLERQVRSLSSGPAGKSGPRPASPPAKEIRR